MDFTGCIILQWHIKNAIDPNSFKDKSFMFIMPENFNAVQSEFEFMSSKSSRPSSAVTQSSEVGEALKKVLIKKTFNGDTNA